MTTGIVTKDDDACTQAAVKSGGMSWAIDGTAHHLCWDVTTSDWTEADQLQVGDKLQTEDGHTVVIAAVRAEQLPTGLYPITYNLAADGLHMYDVDGNGIAVLVHKFRLGVRRVRA